MLDPTYLAGCADGVVKLFSALEADITADIAARVAKMGRYSDTSKWQAMKLRETKTAYDMCNQMLKKCKKEASKQINSTFVLGSKEALKLDDVIYAAAGLHPASIASSRALMDTIIAGVQKTNGLMENLTMTTARDASHSIQNALDEAYMQVMSGAYSYDDAARRCINQLGKKGYLTFTYDNNSHTSLEAATRRALLTGLNQTTAQLQIARAQDLGSDLVEVTSHAGARPEHYVWQGKIYSLSGKHKKYKNFYDATGYGTGPGLCGWNCYHNFYPYIEGVSTPTFEENPASRLGLDNNELYEMTQKQRALERDVRASRRECQVYDAAMQEASEELAEKLQSDFNAASVRLKRREARLKQYCEDNGLSYDSTRVTTYGFGRSTSAKAVWANRKATQQTANVQIAQTKAKTNTTVNASANVQIQSKEPASARAKASGVGIVNSAKQGNDSGGIVLNNEPENGIINAGTERKLLIGEVETESMPKEQLDRIARAFTKNGGVIEMNADCDRYLQRRGAEAITLNANTILLSTSSSRAAVFEELIHSHQWKTGELTDDPLSRAKAEVAAKEKLLKCSKVYHLTDGDVEITKRLLENDRKVLKQLLEGESDG